jgi:hypothetical protein
MKATSDTLSRARGHLLADTVSSAMRADDAELPISDDLLRRLRESGL